MTNKHRVQTLIAQVNRLNIPEGHDYAVGTKKWYLFKLGVLLELTIEEETLQATIGLEQTIRSWESELGIRKKIS